MIVTENMLQKDNKGAHALLVRPAENECVFWTFTDALEVSEGFTEL